MGRWVADAPPVSQGPAHLPDLSRTPVAVLVGPETASAAELTTISFIGRPNTQLFGSATAGRTSGNGGSALFDGYVLALAEVYEMDRTGTLYTGPITPDETVLTKTAGYGTANDATIRAAESWLGQQPACQATAPLSTPAA